MKLVLILIAVFSWSQPAVAEQAGSFDPKHYIEERYYQSGENRIYEYGGIEVEVSDEHIAGKRYLKIKTTSGALFVEKPGPSFLDSDGQNILVDCNGRPEPVRLEKEQELKLQYFVSETVTFDAGFVSHLIINQCNGSIMGYRVMPNPFEIGISIKGKKNRTYRIFNRGLMPNLGFQMDF